MRSGHLDGRAPHKARLSGTPGRALRLWARLLGVEEGQPPAQGWGLGGVGNSRQRLWPCRDRAALL